VVSSCFNPLPDANLGETTACKPYKRRTKLFQSAPRRKSGRNLLHPLQFLERLVSIRSQTQIWEKPDGLMYALWVDWFQSAPRRKSGRNVGVGVIRLPP